MFRNVLKSELEITPVASAIQIVDASAKPKAVNGAEVTAHQHDGTCARPRAITDCRAYRRGAKKSIYKSCDDIHTSAAGAACASADTALCRDPARPTC